MREEKEATRVYISINFDFHSASVSLVLHGYSYLCATICEANLYESHTTRLRSAFKSMSLNSISDFGSIFFSSVVHVALEWMRGRKA